MRAIILATGYCPALEPLTGQRPSVLLPLVDRPFLQHVFEMLVDHGVTRADILLSHHADKIEHFLGDGARWGCPVTYSLVRDPLHPYDKLSGLAFEEGENIVFVHGDRLVAVDLTFSHPALFCSAGKWTGWAVLPATRLNVVPADIHEAALGAQLLGEVQSGTIAISEVSPPLHLDSFEDFQASHWAVLEKRFTGLMLNGREADPGIWLSRNVSLHPAARLVAPVYVGENCRISRGVQLGPRAVIGDDCVLDDHSVVSESLIFAGSYVGQSLELRNAIVDKNRLVNVRVGAAITVKDNFILGSLSDARLKPAFSRAFARTAALLLIVLLSPLMLFIALFCKLSRKRVVRLPAADDDWSTYNLLSFCKRGTGEACEGGLHQFFRHFLPGLINIAKGDLRFVGVAPRALEEIEPLPDHWKTLYLGSKAGIVTEAFVYHGAHPTEDNVFSAEAFYGAMASRKHDLKLLAGYFGRLLGLNRQAAELPRVSEED